MRTIFVAALSCLLAAPAWAGSQGGVAVEGAWARAAASGNSAVYLVIRNHGTAADRLLRARTDAAEKTEIHATTVDAQGVARMHPVEAIEIPPGGKAELAPGGLHVMLVGLKQPLAEGGPDLALTLEFERAGPVEVAAAVRRRAGEAHGGQGQGPAGGH